MNRHRFVTSVSFVYFSPLPWGEKKGTAVAPSKRSVCIAYHQAGHMVHALYHGRRVHEVSLDFRMPGTGVCYPHWTDRPGLLQVLWRARLDLTSRYIIRMAVQNDIESRLAGPLAELRYRQHRARRLLTGWGEPDVVWEMAKALLVALR
jgi:hypothetical protein